MNKFILPSIIGLLMSFSLLGLASIAPNLVTDQASFFFLGIIAFFAAQKISFKFWLKLSWPLYFLLLFSLTLSLFVGTTKGSARWIPLGNYHIQPSQLAIPITALLLSNSIFKKKQTKITLNFFKKFFLIILPPAVLIFIEPDLGSTLLYLISIGGLLSFTPINKKQILTTLGILLIIAILAWNFTLQPYQKNRIFAFLQNRGEGAENYNAKQALIAVGSGKLFGRGLGLGSQSHLRFLPERQTDFIFSSVSEEIGFFGSSIILFLYLTLFFYLLYIAISLREIAEKYYLYAIIIMLFLQTFINIGMNIGLLPITGLTLPLLSYGGSSVLAIMFSLSLAYKIAQTKTTYLRQIG